MNATAPVVDVAEKTVTFQGTSFYMRPLSEDSYTMCVAGAAVGLYLLYVLVRLPLVAQVTGRHIAYLSPHFYAVEAMTLYLLGTCLSSLFSSHRSVRLFGVAAFLSFMAAYAFYATWFISVWCFFAAVLSCIVLLHFPGGGRPRVKGPGRGIQEMSAVS